MRYVNAQDVFPAKLLQEVQRYADGAYIYIPRKEGEKKAWGSNTRSRQELESRNRVIYQAYCAGETVCALAERYFLCEKSIQRILRQQNPGEGG